MQLLKSRPKRVRQAQRLVHIRVTIVSLACCQSRLDLEYVWVGGAGRNRTDDLLLAKQMLSQLSYSPIRLVFLHPAASRTAFVSVTYILIRSRRQKLALLAENKNPGADCPVAPRP